MENEQPTRPEPGQATGAGAPHPWQDHEAEPWEGPKRDKPAE